MDRLICRIPMFIPWGLLTSSKKRSTLSMLSSGSPIPMSTMLETGRPLSSWVNSTWSSSSDGRRSRTLPAMVLAQKAQPIRQPT